MICLKNALAQGYAWTRLPIDFVIIRIEGESTPKYHLRSKYFCLAGGHYFSIDEK